MLLEKIDVQHGQSSTANESKPTIKRGRPFGSKDKNPRKRKGGKNQDGQVEEIIMDEKPPEETEDMTNTIDTEDTKVSNSLENEISLNYVVSGKFWNCDKVITDDAFAYSLALEIMDENEDHEPRSIEECKKRQDWPKWKDIIQVELDSLKKGKFLDP
jgi:hypothetical protein